VWSSAQAESHLRSLELFGMRFGLDRMRRMTTVLGAPQERFGAIHVVGTNGKTSTTRMTAAILERHGLRTGAYTSPHLTAYTERVQVSERDIETDAFAAAVARAAWAAERVNRTLAEDDHVTQFELLTAAALWAMAEQEVEVAVIEAGLGGRYDATNVLASRVSVLTNVGLEHTRWLGPTVRDIAEEKLAVLRPRTTLALGSELDEQALAVATRVAREREARIVRVAAGDDRGGLAGTVPASVELVAGSGPLAAESEPPGAAAMPLRARGAFQQRNFALARVAADAYLRSVGDELSEQAVRAAGASVEVAGRLQILGESPLTVLDSAHNPDAVVALVQALPELLAERPLGLVLGVLEDKDAASMLAELLPLCERAWFTAPPSSRALSPAALESLARQLGFGAVRCEPRPRVALEQARSWARTLKGTPRGGGQAGERRGGAAVLATGSVYLVGDLLAGERIAGVSARSEASSG
jgi:dihydrofolate synthase/folylpolyglutamate synthase